MLFSSLPIDIIHYILSYNETLKLRHGKYMGQISQTDARYNLLQSIPKMVLKQSGVPFTSPRDMMYIFTVPLTNKEHSIELFINEYNYSKRRRVFVVYRNRRSGISLRYVSL